jgi:hypothetical protein
MHEQVDLRAAIWGSNIEAYEEGINGAVFCRPALPNDVAAIIALSFRDPSPSIRV